MAATTKFNRIAQVFMIKIGDPITITGNVINAGKIIDSKEQIENYVNRALETFFYTKWTEFGGDVKKFANFFPELVIPQVNGTLGAGICSVEAFKNLFQLFGLRVDNKYVRIWDMSVYSIAKSGKRIQYIGSADDPGAILVGDEIQFFGAEDSTKVDMEYIIKPIREDGTAFVSSNDAEDSPFNEFWTEQIAQIAADLYNKDAQNFT